MPTYSGGWRRTQRWTPPNGANPNLGAGVDTLHLHPEEPLTGFETPTPGLPSTPGYLFAQDDFMLPVPTMGHDPIDTSPLGHDVGGVPRDVSLIEGQQLAGAAHSQDFGAADVHHFDSPIQRSTRDQYVTQRVEAEFAVSGSRLALVRGRNSYPENNPDGPPDQGHYVMRWIDRQFARRPTRHDAQPLLSYRAAIATDSPAPIGAQATVYTTPFARLLNARRKKLTTPQIRRIPRPADDYAEEDGTEDPQYSNPQYWDEW